MLYQFHRNLVRVNERLVLMSFSAPGSYISLRSREWFSVSAKPSGSLCYTLVGYSRSRHIQNSSWHRHRRGWERQGNEPSEDEGASFLILLELSTGVCLCAKIELLEREKNTAVTFERIVIIWRLSGRLVLFHFGESEKNKDLSTTTSENKYQASV